MNDDKKFIFASLEIAQRYLISFIDKEGNKITGYSDCTQQLPSIINLLRGMGAKNIIIEDRNPFFYDEPNPHNK